MTDSIFLALIAIAFNVGLLSLHVYFLAEELRKLRELLEHVWGVNA